VVVGDQGGHVGMAGKANEVPKPSAKDRGGEEGLVKVSLRDTTIPHEILGIYGAAACSSSPPRRGPGCGRRAARAVLEVVGVRDILSKSLGSDNAHTCQATIQGLRELRSVQQVERVRGREAAPAATSEPTPAANPEGGQP